MKTPEQIFEIVTARTTEIDRGIVIEAMKEFGRQVWLRCASGFEERASDVAESFLYDRYIQDLYLNQIAKDSQERGEYEAKPEECEHEHAYHFHENGPRYCPDCDKYID